MASLIDDITAISIQSPHFSPVSEMELFPVHASCEKGFKYRVAILYGSNGSGKSTIAQGFRNCTLETTQSDITLILKDKSHKPISISTRPKIFVFDEAYVEQNIKVQQEGLDTIVLFGEQSELDAKIRQNEKEMALLQEEIDKREELRSQFSDPSNLLSPRYWVSQIKKQLKRRGGWADMQGITINGNRKAANVTETEIDRIGKISVQMSQEALEEKYKRLLEELDDWRPKQSYDRNSWVTVERIPLPYLPFDGKKTEELLRVIPPLPVLTAREKELLKLFDYNVIRNVKGFLSVSSRQVCPQCFQRISPEHRKNTLESIERILNRDAEEFNESLKSLLLSPIESYRYSDNKIQAKLLDVNQAIERHNEAVREKMQKPFSVIQYDANPLSEAYRALSEEIASLNRRMFIISEQNKRQSYSYASYERENKPLWQKALNNILPFFNNDFQSRKERYLLESGEERDLLENDLERFIEIHRQLSDLNDQIAHLEIDESYQKLTAQREEERDVLRLLESMESEMESLKQKTAELDAQRRNFVLATEKINHSLAYIFFSKDRMRVELGDNQRYALKIRNQTVQPNRISCGERNALALSYFFTDIADNTPSNHLYSEEMLLVIDDPVSSFDMENRVGILSFLRMRLQEILYANPNTKVLFMTHDVSVLYDTLKGVEEISKWCASHAKHAEFSCFHLKKPSIEKFLYKKHSDYTAMMQLIYEYAQNPDPERGVTIGNVMRRTLEAFSTFLFKQSIEGITLDEEVLRMLSNDIVREYFKNSMYRLVLHGESHTEESARGAPETAFWSYLSSEEKQRTAKDILCFMYEINPYHVLKHLSSHEQKNVKNVLDGWMKNIVSDS